MRIALALNVLEKELDAVADFCRAEGLGIEVTAFAYPAHLDRGYAARVERHAAAVEGVDPVICHGPFLNLYPTSPDPNVVAVARERHERALDAAS